MTFPVCSVFKALRLGVDEVCLQLEGMASLFIWVDGFVRLARRPASPTGVYGIPVAAGGHVAAVASLREALDDEIRMRGIREFIFLDLGDES